MSFGLMSTPRMVHPLPNMLDVQTHSMELIKEIWWKLWILWGHVLVETGELPHHHHHHRPGGGEGGSSKYGDL